MDALISMQILQERFVELAKITLRGQITIPVEIRKKLGVKDGDKVIFLEENGRIIMEN
jgi:antitoxin PrlF